MNSELPPELVAEAHRGVAEAQYQLALRYLRGEGVAESPDTSAQWLARAAEQGHTRAQCNLGTLYAAGQGVARNLVTAAQWFREAAVRGEPEACYNLSVMLNEKIVPELVPNEARNFLERAAVEGVPEAQLDWGSDLVQQADAAAQAKGFAWLVEAAKHALPEAQYQIGVCFDSGCGIEPDPNLAVEWYMQAAAQNHASALYNLGLHFELGHPGLAPDREKACAFYREAAAHGHEKAIDSLINLGG